MASVKTRTKGKMYALDDLLTTSEAAEDMGVTAPLVRRFCEQGRLGIKRNDRWMIPREQLEEFKKQERPTGRPRTQ